MLSFLAVALGSYALVCLAAYLLQERLVFFPNPASPALPGTGDVEAVTLQASDGVALQAWLFDGPGERGLVFCHGNGGHRGGRIDAARVLRDMGFDVLLLDYRGYGGSKGRPTEEGTYRDAVAAYDHLRERGCTSIAAYGESLGVAVSIELARRREVTALVLESGFTSIPEMGRLAYPWLPSGRLARVQYDNRVKIGALEARLLLLHSPEDEIVPFAQAEALLAAAPPGTELVPTSGGHNDGGYLREARWVQAVASFLNEDR